MARIGGNDQTTHVDDGGASAPIRYPVATKASSAPPFFRTLARTEKATMSVRFKPRSGASRLYPPYTFRVTIDLTDPNSTKLLSGPRNPQKAPSSMLRSATSSCRRTGAGNCRTDGGGIGGICRNGICCSGTWMRKYLGISSRPCGAHSEESLPRRDSPRNRKIEERKHTAESLAPLLPGDCRNLPWQRIMRVRQVGLLTALAVRGRKRTGTPYNSRPVGRRRTGIAGTPRRVIPARG